MKDLTLYESIFLVAILRLGKKAYGINIRREIRNQTKKTLSYGTLYSYLDQLFRKGLVERSVGEPTKERGGRRKVYYRMTPRGKEALKAAHELHKSIWEALPEHAWEETSA
ncbi:MAG: PadR family transcriptional regulator [Candidatus Aminicenantes bacterium]|nr:PadR family transcriptional regulator [Candidatus Aminicenantes bacterium]